MERFLKFTVSFFLALIAFGLLYRFAGITENQFIYYDEGMWLNHARPYLDWLDKNSGQNILKVMVTLWMAALSTAKFLWAFISSLRIFVTGPDGYYFSRVVAAVCGSLTILLTYVFAARHFQSKWVGILSALFLALYPSHYYYSRIALQETLTGVLFLSGLYLYFYGKGRFSRTVLSGLVFAGVFFSSYRMVITPFLIGFCELFIAFAHRQKIDARRFLYSSLVFAAVIFVLGSLNHGANTYVTFGWMFHQQHQAQANAFDIFNLFSYPYYIFSLESLIFGFFFFGNILFLIKKDFQKLMPFALACLVMALFTLADEKGVRYMTFVMPMAAMAAAVFFAECARFKNSKAWQVGLYAVLFCMLGWHTARICQIARFHTDYEASAAEIFTRTPNAGILSTQDLIQNLYTPTQLQVRGVPVDHTQLELLYAKGYRYLIIDPQAFISKTEDGRRFSLQLQGYLGFLYNHMPPATVYEHFNDALLKRFVLEHNTNLRQSLAFIKANKTQHLGQLKVYDILHCLQLFKNLNL